MKTTKRFDEAVSKLYSAFHSGALNAMDCKACAVGNICDNSDEWAYNGLYSWGDVNRISIGFKNKSGYSPKELSIIECLFLYGTKHESQVSIFRNNYSLHDIKRNPAIQEEATHLQFNGLCAVVEYLCELDNIPNVMDYKKLFEQEENKPKYELKFN